MLVLPNMVVETYIIECNYLQKEEKYEKCEQCRTAGEEARTFCGKYG